MSPLIGARGFRREGARGSFGYVGGESGMEAASSH
jgi:hypothetical protein